VKTNPPPVMKSHGAGTKCAIAGARVMIKAAVTTAAPMDAETTLDISISSSNRPAY
jgi:hypothetical protein